MKYLAQRPEMIALVAEQMRVAVNDSAERFGRTMSEPESDGRHQRHCGSARQDPAPSPWTSLGCRGRRPAGQHEEGDHLEADGQDRGESKESGKAGQRFEPSPHAGR
ncbi:MAG: hypothetical protein ACYDC1_08290 [Limisphaerales bacterium]